MGKPTIIGPLPDALLILGAPVIALALVLFGSAQWGAESVWALVITFGAVGHHLPGFVRAYSDADLRRRFGARLLFAPPLVFALSYSLAGAHLHALIWISLLWSMWHGAMQHYGFMRIYDAKSGVKSAAVQRGDLVITLVAFGAVMLWSPHQLGAVLDGVQQVGLPTPPLAFVEQARRLAVGAAVAAVAGYVFVSLRARARGQAPSPHKLLLLLTTVGAVAYARVWNPDPFVAVAAFEVLHDVQYLAIVWAFGARSVGTGQGTRVGRFLFSRSAGSLLMYVGACLAYGGLAYLVHTGAGDKGGELHRVAIALLATSALLHYYFDGFIWKVREPGTRSALNLGDPQLDPELDPSVTSHESWRRPLIHAAILIGAILVLRSTQLHAPDRAALDRAHALAELVPGSPTAQRNLASELQRSGSRGAAVPHLRLALAQQPYLHGVCLELADALAAQGELAGALDQLDQCEAGAPQVRGIHRRRAALWARTGEFQAAAVAYRFALAEGSPDAAIHDGLGYALMQLGDLEAAQQNFRRALELDPSFGGAWLNQGLVLAKLRRLDAAEVAVRRAIELAPQLPAAHNSLGGLLMMKGQPAQAQAAFVRALEIDPNFAPAQHNLARARAQQP